jgi:hypothetical protein
MFAKKKNTRLGTDTKREAFCSYRRSQKSVPKKIYYIESLYGGLLRVYKPRPGIEYTEDFREYIYHNTEDFLEHICHVRVVWHDATS